MCTMPRLRRSRKSLALGLDELLANKYPRLRETTRITDVTEQKVQ